MKTDKFLLLFFLLFFTTSYSQKKNDTLVLVKNKYQKIYIEKNKNSKYYKFLNNFGSFKINSRDNLIKLKGLSTRFVRIYLYKEKYLLYAPCDWCMHTRIQILNKNIQFENCEFTQNKLLSLKRIKKDHFKIIYIDFNNNKNILFIKNIDSAKGIYEFTNKTNAETETYLMVDVSKIEKSNIIVNECFEKTKEFDFSKP